MEMLKYSLFLFLLHVIALTNGDVDPDEIKCEEITVPMCMGIGYNYTSLPNELNHYTQEEAGLDVHQYQALVAIKCSKDLQLFLCSVFVPICIKEYPKPLRACRYLCERARAGCLPVMQQYGFAWPERMSCEKFPEPGDPNEVCMHGPDQSTEQSSVPDTGIMNLPAYPRATRRPPSQPPTDAIPLKCVGKNKNSKFCRDQGKSCACRCRKPLVSVNRDSHLYNRSIKVGNVDNCGLPCYGVFITAEEKEFASIWITLWSALCCVSTLMTVTTFLIDTERFKYPERPIVFLSACYFMVSVGYLVRVFMGHEAVACEEKMIRYNATGPVACTMVFLLVYFFGMASSIWWVVLSFTWFLAAGLKWGNEAIASYSQYFHLAAWLIPTVKSVAVLVMNAIDGDAVAGICYVGNQNMDNLKGFVMAPLVVYLMLGTSFLLGGFVSLFRIRNVIKQQGRSKADKLEKLMIRIGIFSVLYTVPATIVIACYFYESTLYFEWMGPLVCPCETPRARPLYSILMLKYFMALAVGITSGVWIWSGKTLDSWRRFWYRITGRGKRYENHRASHNHHIPHHPHSCTPHLTGLNTATSTSSKPRPVKQISYNASASPAVPVTASVQSSHLGSIQKQAPLSHV